MNNQSNNENNNILSPNSNQVTPTTSNPASNQNIIMPVSGVPEVKSPSSDQTTINTSSQPTTNSFINQNTVSPPLTTENNLVSENPPLEQSTPNNPPELKLENSSPFDIGVNSPTTTQPVTPTILPPLTPQPTTSNSIVNSNENMITPPQPQKPTIPIDTTPPASESNIVPVSKYLLHMILFSIPIVGFIMLILKAVDKKDKNISNFAKAQLILSGIIIVLSILLFVVLGASLISTLPLIMNE